MPELPEVETVRRGLERTVVGRRITRVEVGRERTVRRTSADAVVNGLTGATVLAAGRRGKYLLLPLDTGDVLMVHLRMTGQLLLSEPGAARPPHTHVVMHLSAGGGAASTGGGAASPGGGAAAGDDPVRQPAELWFVDPRTFGEVVVFDPDHADVEMPELAALGLDPLADEWGPDELGVLLRRRTTHLKPLLLDQHVVAGIGNIYADEILHAARLHPDLPGTALNRRDVVRIHDEMQRILHASVRAGGSTLRDAQYVDLMGEGGSYQDDHRVYGRAGERCVTCGRGIVRRLVHSGRSTHYCPVCQRARTTPAVPSRPVRGGRAIRHTAGTSR